MWRWRRREDEDLMTVFAWRPPDGWDTENASEEQAEPFWEAIFLKEEIDIWVSQLGPRDAEAKARFREESLEVLSDPRTRAAIGEGWPVWVRVVEKMTVVEP